VIEPEYFAARIDSMTLHSVSSRTRGLIPITSPQLKQPSILRCKRKIDELDCLDRVSDPSYARNIA